MAEDILAQPQDNILIKESAADKDKTKKYTVPVYPLPDLIKFCTKIYTELGINSYHTNELIAKVHNVVYATIKQKLSGAQDLRLLEMKHGTGYKLTPLFLKILKPLNDQEKIEGIAESIRGPFIYDKLIDEFNGHPLPSEQSLSSRLIRSFGIKEYAVNKAAAIFLYNLREYGFVTADGILKMPGAEIEKSETIKLPVITQPEAEKPKLPESGYIDIPIPLQSGKRAYLRIPEDYKIEDCDRIAKFVEALK